MANRKRVLIMGAAGRDFHNFNVKYRNDPTVEVVAFTATQIPDIEGREYPKELCGEHYTKGIPIHDESELEALIADLNVDEVVFSYSDVAHEYVMHKASQVLKCGVTFSMLGGEETMVKSSKPVVAITAVRTGCGKSQTTRRVRDLLVSMGKKVVAIRHPMPYGNLVKQRVQRFASVEDLKKHECTIEEMEEYEPHIANGTVVYAGVDYEAILREAEKEADVILWDGGNNDMAFYKPDLYITVADPLRPGHEIAYYPGESNLRLADIVVINKIDSADMESIAMVRENIQLFNPTAKIIEAASPLTVEKPEVIMGKRVLCIEDGPTLTHGEMTIGAAIVAAIKFGATELVDPRPFAVGTIADTFEKYPDIGTLLPAMGYGGKQVQDLEKTVAACDCDAVIIGTPIDLNRVIKIKQPNTRVGYDLQEIGRPNLEDYLKKQFS